MKEKKKPSGGIFKRIFDFIRSLIHDLFSEDFRRTIRRDFEDIYLYYLDEETRKRLSGMKRVKRVFYFTFHLLKSMFLKLTPVRKVLLIVGLFLCFKDYNESNQGTGMVVGVLILVFILILELKDKLLAHDELQVGRSVQKAFVPDKNPVLKGWDIWLFFRPANEVGGDLVDYLTIDDNRLSIALGDVAGKGLGAALLMVKLQATLRALAPNYTSFEELGKELNRILCRDGLQNRFASLIYIELAPGSSHVRVLNAGHLPPFAIRKNTLKEMPKGSPALGLNRKSRYTEQKVLLKPEDILLIYSDGITDAGNTDGELFGEQRLYDLLPALRGFSAEEAGKYLIRKVDDFVGDARPTDDISLVVLRYMG